MRRGCEIQPRRERARLPRDTTRAHPLHRTARTIKATLLAVAFGSCAPCSSSENTWMHTPVLLGWHLVFSTDLAHGVGSQCTLA